MILKTIRNLFGPQEFIIYTRQFDGTIKLGEARDYTGIYDESTMVKQILDGKLSNVVLRAKNADCNYIVIHKSAGSDVDLEDYGYNVLGENDSYILYKFD